MSEATLDDFGTKLKTGKTGEAVKNIPTQEKISSTGRYRKSYVNGEAQWASVMESDYVGISKAVRELPSGKYGVYLDNEGAVHFSLEIIKYDEIIRFTDSVADTVLKEIEHFWNIKSKFKKNKFLHRRGYLFYGPQGSGKSIITQQIINGVIELNGIAINGAVRPDILIEAIKKFRKIEPDRPIVVIFEDIDAIITRWGEPEILSYLDGEDKQDTILNIATTNYPEVLDKRIVSRPKRFDRVIKIDMPDINIRKEYFRYKMPKISNDKLEQWSISTENFSFAALADLIISVKCFGYKFEEAVDKLKLFINSSPNSNEFKDSKLGFK